MYLQSNPHQTYSSSQMSRVVWTAWNTSISNSFKISSFALSSMFKGWFGAIEVASASAPTSMSFRDEFSCMKALWLTKLGEGTWVMVWEPAKFTTLSNDSKTAEWVHPSVVDGVAEVWAEPRTQKKECGCCSLPVEGGNSIWSTEPSRSVSTLSNRKSVKVSSE